MLFTKLLSGVISQGTNFSDTCQVVGTYLCIIKKELLHNNSSGVSGIIGFTLSLCVFVNK